MPSNYAIAFYAPPLIVIAVLVILLLGQKKFVQQLREVFPTEPPKDKTILEDEPVVEFRIFFSGNITPGLRKDIREVYYKRNPLFQVIYVLCAIASVVLAVYMDDAFSRFDLIFFDLIFFELILAAVVLLVVAFWLPQIWWRWWWPKYTSHFGPRVSGEVNELGVRFTPYSPILLWESFWAGEMSSKAVLLYLTKGYVYPIHRSMFQTESMWTEFVRFVEKNVKKLSKYE